MNLTCHKIKYANMQHAHIHSHLKMPWMQYEATKIPITNVKNVKSNAVQYIWSHTYIYIYSAYTHIPVCIWNRTKAIAQQLNYITTRCAQYGQHFCAKNSLTNIFTCIHIYICIYNTCICIWLHINFEYYCFKTPQLMSMKCKRQCLKLQISLISHLHFQIFY